MTYAEIQTLVRDVKTVFLATTDGKRAQVRPMSAYAWFDGELWMATAARSVKARDARKCPRVEVCAMARDWSNARIEAKCRISRAPADKKKMFAAFAWMRNFFASAAHPSWVVLRLTPTRIRAMGRDMQYREIAPEAMR
jgi:uncharacterized pyridoxamine 5'-phosphate oxidase family protein